MTQLKDTPEEKISARYRYWVTPPEFLTIRVADIEASIPRESWKSGSDAERTFDLPAAAIFGRNVPRISLRQLAEILPDHVVPSDGVVKLPPARLAAAYRLVEHREELPPEKLPPKELPPEPEMPPLPPTPKAEENPVSPESLRSTEPPVDAGEAASGRLVEPGSGDSSRGDAEPAEKNRLGVKEEKRKDDDSTFSQRKDPEEPASLASAPPPKDLPGEPARAAESAQTSDVPAPLPEKTPLSEKTPPDAVPLSAVPPPPPGKIPARRIGLFAGFPIFRKKAAPPFPLPPGIPEPPSAPAASFDGIRLPNLKEDEAPAGDAPDEPVGPAASDPLAKSAEPAAGDPVVGPPAPVAQEPVAIPPAQPPAPPPAEPAAADVPLLEKMEPPPQATEPIVKMLQTEAMSREAHGNEIIEQEPLQALFLTDEIMSVDRVIELCGGLPGINSCVLAHGPVVVASHNVPQGVDLVSMSAHAADMLQSMRASSARMGVGTVPAVTLHTEKGVISFFHRDDLTMLVFHRDRGFIPGVREKMAAVLGELTKARLTLPVGTHHPDPSD